MALFEVNPDLSRVAGALERIADALELATGMQRPEASKLPDESSALYHDDLKALIRETKREDYMRRTGTFLAEDEDPPSHAGVPE